MNLEPSSSTETGPIWGRFRASLAKALERIPPIFPNRERTETKRNRTAEYTTAHTGTWLVYAVERKQLPHPCKGAQTGRCMK